MSASPDVVSDDHARRLARRSSWRTVLLTLAVLALVYQQVPPPFGAIVVETWLPYALPALGALLLAQFVGYVVRIIWSQLRRTARQVKKLMKGFSVTFDPNRTEDDEDDQAS